MTLVCPRCECVDVELVADNSATYPETRIEFFECRDCGYEFREVLVA